MSAYTVILTNVAGSATSSPPASLTVIDPPIITGQPTNLLVLTGANIAFAVSLTDSSAFFQYQWQMNQTNLPNATNSAYVINSVGTNDAGNYSVIVTNPAGTAASANATLSVVQSPVSITNYASSTAIFTAYTFGPKTLGCQWQKNGTNLFDSGNILGTTNNVLTIANISDSDAAIYSAVLSNADGSITTSNATLTVNDSLIFAIQPLGQTVDETSNVTFYAAAYGAPPIVFQWYFNNTPVGPPTFNTNLTVLSLRIFNLHNLEITVFRHSMALVV